jgi:hypothetical protein
VADALPPPAKPTKKSSNRGGKFFTTRHTLQHDVGGTALMTEDETRFVVRACVYAPALCGVTRPACLQWDDGFVAVAVIVGVMVMGACRPMVNRGA